MADFSFESDPMPASIDLDRLPYRFVDPVPVDRDRKKPLERFGSRIDGTEKPREELFRVAAIAGHDRVLLEERGEVRLLGVGKARDADGATVALRALCEGRKVYLRADPAVPAAKGVYLYLPNRTCINARMVKSGTVDAETSVAYRMQKRYAGYAREATESA